MLLPFRTVTSEPETELIGAMDDLLSELGLLGKKRTKIYQLSGGQQRRAFLARALLIIMQKHQTGPAHRAGAR